ncbi:MAG: PQQ-like beta-propeller repeat protein [Polyangiaceae bacterium]|nr:PQQ-like beta-propeller repeat protein [Polyangiaceae bacterium]
MSAIHVVVRPSGSPSQRGQNTLLGLIDLIVDGVNLTARIGEALAVPLLTELSHAVLAIETGRKTRASVQVYATDDVWEIGLESDGQHVLLTLFRTAPAVEVVVFERRLRRAALREALAEAISSAAVDAQGDTGPLAAAARLLAALAPASDPLAVAQRSSHALSRTMGGVKLAANVSLRKGSQSLGRDGVERADLHALLALGRVELTVRRKAVSLGECHVFLLAERLVALAEDVLASWNDGRPCFRRVELSGLTIGAQRGPAAAPLALTVSRRDGTKVTFPELEPLALVRAVARFSRALSDLVRAEDPSQALNLRLVALAEGARQLERGAADQTCEEAPVTNSSPESYRSFAPAARSESRGRWEHGSKMRFLPRWVATVPSIDLSATFLCGDRIIVGSKRETACIHRNSGSLLWRVPMARAASVATPAGLARIHPDGLVTLHDLGTGAAKFEARLQPRTGGGASGAVVHSAGLPKLLVIAEGDRRVTALDLVSGDVRWRFTARRPGTYRVRRAGRLLLVTGGDRSLSALDVTSGELVWRLRSDAALTGDVSVDHDSAFVLTQDGAGAALLHVDPWSGQVRWRAEVDERVALSSGCLVARDSVVVPLRDRRGAGLMAFDRSTGARLFAHEPGLCAPVVSWLCVDADVVGNTASGALLCLDGRTGALRYSHVFPRHVDADQPRRLEPVLRSGALFVPQHQVHVVRPRDGELLGTVPTDLIPDLLRVDERCDVYVAEESGHVAAFGAAARLTLIKG